MIRTLVGTGIGAFVGLLILALAGAWGGYNYGDEWFAAPAPPPSEAALRSMVFCMAFFWWFAMPVGGIIGGLAGLGSWAARRCRHV